MASYYNEIDPFAAAWLRELIKEGLIANGEVDERSIEDVQPDDLRGFTQCHFFGGIGVWSYALRLAGWPDDRPVWTGSCPCPSFSAAGKGAGFNDPRHLWPHWYRLIRECRPAIVFGEQVNAAIGHGWLDLVQSDLEAAECAVGKAVLGACSVGAPHIRQRLYFVAESKHGGCGFQMPQREGDSKARDDSQSAIGVSGRVADANKSRQQAFGGCSIGAGIGGDAGLHSEAGELGHTEHAKSARFGEHGGESLRQQEPDGFGKAGFTNGFWADAEWLWCRDGKYRPTQPGLFPLVAGTSKGMVLGSDPGQSFDADSSPEARVGRLRGYGNAICAEVAAEFIKSFTEIHDETDALQTRA